MDRTVRTVSDMAEDLGDKGAAQGADTNVRHTLTEGKQPQATSEPPYHRPNQLGACSKNISSIFLAPSSRFSRGGPAWAELRSMGLLRVFGEQGAKKMELIFFEQSKLMTFRHSVLPHVCVLLIVLSQLCRGYDWAENSALYSRLLVPGS